MFTRPAPVLVLVEPTPAPPSFASCVATHVRRADAFAIEVADRVFEIGPDGKANLRTIARTLDAHGVATRYGKDPWTAAKLELMLKRAAAT